MPSPTVALYVFLAWLVFEVMLLVVSLMRGEIMPAMRLAVDKVNASDSQQDKEQMAKGFAWIGIVWFAITTAVAAFAFRYAAERSVIGSIVFVCVGGWSLYQTASSPFVMRKMYPGSTGTVEWIESAIGTAVWTLLFLVLIAEWLKPAASI